MEEKTKSIDSIKTKIIFNVETMLIKLRDNGWACTNIDMEGSRLIFSKQAKGDSEDSEPGKLTIVLCYKEDIKNQVVITGDRRIVLLDEELMIFSILKQFTFGEVGRLFFSKL